MKEKKEREKENKLRTDIGKKKRCDKEQIVKKNMKKREKVKISEEKWEGTKK